MTDKPGPTLRAQWLGQQLHELRAATGLKLKDVGEVLQRDGTTIGRFESGEYPIRQSDLVALLDFYGVSTKRKRDALLRLHDDAWRTDWWDDQFDDAVFDPRFVDYVWLEQRSTNIFAFDTTAVTGLVQTERYARAVIDAAEPTASADQIERWVQLRMARQEILSRSEPPRLHLVLDEAILRREVGDEQVLGEQLVHLRRLAARPNVELRVLPFRVGAHICPYGPFRIFQMADPYPEVGYVETLAGSLYVEPPKTAKFVAAYDGLRKAALTQQRSIELITAIVQNLE
ncbi:helix-turn-helix domain-containing protein [Solihabitans fulvus]|uniref:Helix-turn-helix domain-containing protein n=1 Tax=Solihabitans fulvus TaxID=1892852 RepID=A0A5B2XBI9_9PSEU|nr:helix-turn-helix transcriptional regulator [Solihabitans fulvus]KAA2260152.1 helix-turn-helix domain-containing protein [Solihabitans fulvus]